VFACFGIAFPAVILVAEWIGIRRDDPAALLLAQLVEGDGAAHRGRRRVGDRLVV
jgi:hypothetical protein